MVTMSFHYYNQNKKNEEERIEWMNKRRRWRWKRKRRRKRRKGRRSWTKLSRCMTHACPLHVECLNSDVLCPLRTLWRAERPHVCQPDSLPSHASLAVHVYTILVLHMCTPVSLAAHVYTILALHMCTQYYTRLCSCYICVHNTRYHIYWSILSIDTYA